MKHLLSLGAILFAGAAHAQLSTLNEGFDDITTLPAAGWVITNNSTTVGSTNYFQGNPAVFGSQSGTDTASAASYIGANFNATTGTNTISDWLITPTLNLGGTFTFYTRTATASPFPDRLEVRQSSAGTSTNVGTTDSSVGDFTGLLLSVNPSLATGGYPESWTKFTVTSTGTGTGRLAFRYYVTGGGPTGNNSNYIGMDTVTYSVSSVPEPASMAVLGLGALALVRRRRRA